MSGTSNPYRTVVVGTDGSESSRRAVARAGTLARAQDTLRDDAYQVVGSHPVEDTVRSAAERAGGLAGIKGRLLGSVPDATRRSECDVLVVHTTD